MRLARRILRQHDAARFPPRKEQAKCCRSRVDGYGRYPVGFCSPGCIRRPENWRLAHGRADH